MVNSWIEKRDGKKEHQIKINPKRFADMPCPMVTGISLRIVSEAAYEEYKKYMKLDQITPFWRVVEPNSNLAHKLTCGIDFLIENQIRENISL